MLVTAFWAVHHLILLLTIANLVRGPDAPAVVAIRPYRPSRPQPARATNHPACSRSSSAGSFKLHERRGEWRRRDALREVWWHSGHHGATATERIRHSAAGHCGELVVMMGMVVAGKWAAAAHGQDRAVHELVVVVLAGGGDVLVLLDDAPLLCSPILKPDFHLDSKLSYMSLTQKLYVYYLNIVG